MKKARALYRMAQRSRNPGAYQATGIILRCFGLHKREVLNRSIGRVYCVSDIWHAQDLRGYRLGFFWEPEPWIEERYG